MLALSRRNNCRRSWSWSEKAWLKQTIDPASTRYCCQVVAILSRKPSHIPLTRSMHLVFAERLPLSKIGLLGPSRRTVRLNSLVFWASMKLFLICSSQKRTFLKCPAARWTRSGYERARATVVTIMPFKGKDSSLVA